MVKGVNKRVIEVNQTGNKFFEKIVFYISPEYGDLSLKQLQRATDNFSLNLRTATAPYRPLRKRFKLRKKRFFICLGIFLALLILIGGALIRLL